jgi:amino acid transporter
MDTSSEGEFFGRSAIVLLAIILTSPSLKSRHIQFIALGGTIGTGLFLGIGTAFANAGPVSVLLGYSITGIAVFGMMQSLGEMSTWLPLPGAIPQYCARYADPALGFAVGWNNCKLAK